MNRRRASIVIVDDNDMMRSILRGMLRGDAFEVIGEARNGNAGVDTVSRLRPDIVCLDVMMPEKDGLTALCEIKEAFAEIDVVMITSNADTVTVQQSIEHGASAFIIKPFNAARVLDTLHKLVERRKRR